MFKVAKRGQQLRYLDETLHLCVDFNVL